MNPRLFVCLQNPCPVHIFFMKKHLKFLLKIFSMLCLYLVHKVIKVADIVSSESLLLCGPISFVS